MVRTANLVFFLPNVLGGVYSYTVNLVDALKDSSLNCKVVTYGFDDLIKSELDYIKFVKLSKNDTYVTSLKKIRRWIESDDVIIANDSLELDVFSYFKLSNPLFYILHGVGKHYTSVMGRTDFVNVFCDSDSLCNIFKHSGKNFTVLYPIVQESRYEPKSILDCLYVGFVGRLEKEKGAHLIEEFDLMFNPHWEFIFPQQGSDDRFIENIVKKSSHIDIDPKNVSSILDRCHFLFFASENEGFGMVVLEAMRLGVIPILFNINTGIVPLLTHGVNCIKFDNLADLRTDVSNIMSNKKAFALLSQNAHDYAEVMFAPEKQVDIFKKTIINLRAVNIIHERVSIPILHQLPNLIFRTLKKFRRW
jgi:glycosyltransferase involved in cell wall biosynthesis